MLRGPSRRAPDCPLCFPTDPVLTVRSILLVDDDPTFLQHAERFLAQDPTNRVVGTARDVRSAVEQARALQPDLVLLDLSMPGADGFEAVAPLREAAPEATILVVTMMEEAEHRSRALDLDVDGFILKSRLADDLLLEIDRLVPVHASPESASPESASPESTSLGLDALSPDLEAPPSFPDRASTGVPGLDAILCGGVPCQEVYLAQGGPGTGKTTLGLQFLKAGVEAGERSLYVTLSQTRRSLAVIARSHGWTLDDIHLREYGDANVASQSVFPSAEVELEETVALIRDAVSEIGATRLVVDTISDLRELSGEHSRYRRELRELRRFLAAEGCTVLFLDDVPESTGDYELQNQANGVLALRQHAPEYGSVRRSLQVIKMRSTPFLTGCHNFRIQTGGLVVYPRVMANGHNKYDTWAPLSSGLPDLDDMLGGGLREGTACLVAGPTGSGKSAVAFQYAHAAAERGENASVFLFNERLETFYMRSRGLGMSMEPHVEAGRLQVQQVDTGVITPSEFAQRVRQTVESDGARVVVIDSLSGYVNAMLRQDLLVSQLHELITYLSQHGVLTLLVVDQSGPFSGNDQAGPSHVSYLADSVLLLGYHQMNGHRRRTISVLKQRHGPHALDVRGFNLSEDGLGIGEHIDGFQGLTLDPPIFATLFPSGHGADAGPHPSVAQA